MSGRIIIKVRIKAKFKFKRQVQVQSYGQRGNKFKLKYHPDSYRDKFKATAKQEDWFNLKASVTRMHQTRTMKKKDGLGLLLIEQNGIEYIYYSPLLMMRIQFIEYL